MEKRYKDLLPDSAKDLVDRLEAFAGFEIGVAENDTPLLETDPNPTAPAADVHPDRATILLRQGVFETHGIVHELLHIERFWIDAVPQIVPREGAPEDNWTITGSIENCLEHVVIVPKEAAFGYDPFPYWARTATLNWELLRPTNAWATRKHCLLGWLSAQALVQDQNVQKMVRERVRDLGHLDEAERFAEKILRQLRNPTRKPAAAKADALATVLRFLDIEKAEVLPIAFDVKGRRQLAVTLP